MVTLCVDDTDPEATFSMVELARFLGVTKQYVSWCAKHRSDSKNHFWCRDYPVMIVSRYSKDPKAIYQRNRRKTRQKETK